MMTPVDPVFLLIPIVRAVYKVRVPFHWLLLVLLLKQDRTLGNFRPMDDILDDAVTVLTSQDGKIITPDIQLSRQDLVKFTSMKCVASAMKNLCEVKGGTPSLLRYIPLMLCNRNHARDQRLSVFDTGSYRLS
jgi:hypothetical protein